MRIIDLSHPIDTGHPRYSIERSVKGDLASGDLFQATTIRLGCHGFTHVDARRHFFPDGRTIEETELDALVGEAVVVDLMDVAANEAIGPGKLADRGGAVTAGARVILKTGWHRHRDFYDISFWRDAPYLTRDAAEWLRDRAIRTIAYDFPQDYCIRQLLDGIVAPVEQHVTHDVLLRAGVHMIEYLTNTAEISAARVFLSAAPLKIVGADGAPARVYAIEGSHPI
ncbi:MAG: cyclase family protein [Hyphomicrobiaceae bacterium]